MFGIRCIAGIENHDANFHSVLLFRDFYFIATVLYQLQFVKLKPRMSVIQKK